MKKRTIILFAIFAIVVCLLIATILFLSVGRAGGEIGFEATIDKIENGIAFWIFAVISQRKEVLHPV